MKKLVAAILTAALFMVIVPMNALAGSHSGGNNNHNYAQCTVSNCNATANHQHNGTTYSGHYNGDGHNYHQNCGVAGCTQTGDHSHNGNSSSQHHARCTIENCSITGNHEHNGQTYSGHYTGDGHQHHSGGDASQYPGCNVKDCKYVGEHEHNGTRYNREDYAAKFSDIPMKSGDENPVWYYEAVNTLTGLGIISGTDDYSFAPQADIKRGEFTKLLFNMAETMGVEPQQVPNVPFTDLSNGSHWATGYIGWAYENGIVNGYDDNTFRPNDYITRQDIAVMIKNFMDGYLNVDLEETGFINFDDNDHISAYARDAVDYVAQHGLMQGDGSGVFGPKAYTPRSQTAQLLFNCMNRV